jgi:hypothetical protein
MRVYDKILRLRSDMTNWLIHFTRKDSDAGVSPHRRLLSILEQGVLRPGWSERNGRRTVYGQYPAVCFTEQPLSAFLAYLSARTSDSMISGYGVVVHKQDMYAEGGRPVFYDSCDELRATDPGFVAGTRMVHGFPPEKQYRYVAFNPNANTPIDWTHEREWRWARGHEPDDPDADEVGTFRLAGTGVASGDGLSWGRAHVIVAKDEDVEWLRQEVQSFVPTGGLKRDLAHRVRWYRRLQERVGVISLQSVERNLRDGQVEYGRLDTWPADDIVPLVGSKSSKSARELFHEQR